MLHIALHSQFLSFKSTLNDLTTEDSFVKYRPIKVKLGVITTGTKQKLSYNINRDQTINKKKSK